MIGDIFEEFENLMDNLYSPIGYKKISGDHELSIFKQLLFSNNNHQIRLRHTDWRDDVFRYDLEIDGRLIRTIDTSHYTYAEKAVIELNKSISKNLTNNNIT